MKKILALILAVLMIAATLAFTSCGKKNDDEPDRKGKAKGEVTAIDPKTASDELIAAVKKSTELTSVKGSASGKVIIDANVEEQVINGKVDVNGAFTVDNLKSSDMGADVSLSVKIDGIEEAKQLLGDGPIELKAILKDGVAYLDVKTSSAQIPSMKFKVEVPIDQAVNAAESIDTDEVDTSEAEEYIKSATVTTAGGEKTYELVIDSAKIKAMIEDEGDVTVNSIDDPVLTVSVSKDGYVKGCTVKVRNVDISTEDEGSAKGEADFTLQLENPGADYKVNANVNPDEYQDLQEMLGGLLGGFGF